jgi:hypothetical protein
MDGSTVSRSELRLTVNPTFFSIWQGDEVVGVETGMTTFMNHGCNGTYNNGLSLTKTEATLQFGDGPAAAGYGSREGRYDPFSAREFPYFRCHTSCFTLRNIRAGEELLTNYLVFGGSDPGQLWEDTLAEGKAMCSGSELGLVQFYERTTEGEPQQLP